MLMETTKIERTLFALLEVVFACIEKELTRLIGDCNAFSEYVLRVSSSLQNRNVIFPSFDVRLALLITSSCCTLFLFNTTMVFGLEELALPTDCISGWRQAFTRIFFS